MTLWERRHSSITPRATLKAVTPKNESKVCNDFASEWTRRLSQEKEDLWKATIDFHRELSRVGIRMDSHTLYKELFKTEPSDNISRFRFTSWLRKAITARCDNTKGDAETVQSRAIAVAGRVFGVGNDGCKNPVLNWRMFCTMMYALDNPADSWQAVFRSGFLFGADDCVAGSWSGVLETAERLSLTKIWSLIDPFLREELKDDIRFHVEEFISDTLMRDMTKMKIPVRKKIAFDPTKTPLSSKTFIDLFENVLNAVIADPPPSNPTDAPNIVVVYPEEITDRYV
jgi:hypothetical protein